MKGLGSALLEMGNGKVFVQLAGVCRLHHDGSVDHEKRPVMEGEGLAQLLG